MALLDDVKLDLRINHTKMDADISGTILAAKTDLKIAGIPLFDETDPLLVQAVKLHCRYIYNYQGQSERWERSYIALKQALALCSDYNTEATTP